MNKVPSYEVKAPCRDTSFDVASGNSAPNSPKSQEEQPVNQVLHMEECSTKVDILCESMDELRCNESIAEDTY